MHLKSKLVTLREASELMGRKFATMSSWRDRGLLVACGEIKNRHLFRMSDIESLCERMADIDQSHRPKKVPKGHITFQELRTMLDEDERRIVKLFDAGKVKGKVFMTGQRKIRVFQLKSVRMYLQSRRILQTRRGLQSRQDA